jgi:hypothetical protein
MVPDERRGSRELSTRFRDSQQGLTSENGLATANLSRAEAPSKFVTGLRKSLDQEIDQ